MKLTTKGRYAVTAMLDIVQQGEDSLVSLAEISQRQDISIAYLEQLFGKLRKKDLVASVRGTHGGYKLAQPANDISVLDIINAVDDNIDATKCDNLANCKHGGRCNTHDLWFGLSQHIADYLSAIKLSQLTPSENEDIITINIQ